MGSSFEVHCSNCGYTTRSSCGRDYGMMAVVETYVCLDCAELDDVLIGEEGEVFSRKSLTPEQKKEYYRCGACGGTNITLWDADKRPCPKCGAKLEKPEQPDMLWD